MACMRAARQRGAKGCVPSGDDARTHPEPVHARADRQSRTPAGSHDRPNCTAGPMQTSDPFFRTVLPPLPSLPCLHAAFLPSFPAGPRKSSGSCSCVCAVTCAHARTPSWVQTKSAFVTVSPIVVGVSRCCGPAINVVPPTLRTRYRRLLARPCSGLDRGRHMAVELLVRLRPFGEKLQT